MTKDHTVEPGVSTADMDVEFLDAADRSEQALWLDLWRSWPGREVMAHPAYVRLFSRPGDRAMCAAAKTAEGGILYPVIVRPVASEPWAGGESLGCDFTNAYGYGGPFAWKASDADTRHFWDRFGAWARSLGAVTAFCRLSLFPEQIVAYPGEVVDRGPNVVRSLAPTPDEIWRDYEGKVRKNVQRARREGLRVEFDPTGARLGDFLAVYESTMDRRNALDQYYFPRALFESLFEELPGQVMFAHVLSGEKVVSSELLLVSAEHAYFFLGGTLAEAFAMRPNDLLKHESFLRCRDMGIRQFVLGGGYAPEDGLLRYKRSFAPGGDVPYRIGTATLDPAASARLVERRREWERSQGKEWAAAAGFFPAYRS